jgi:NAD(P)H-nitrite reductase large subunit
VHIAIVGNGITGITAARTLRDRQADWKITVISAESPHFYSRPALMYLYLGHLSFDDTKPFEDRYWKDQRIDLLHDRVTAIDAERSLMTLERGGALAYDQLLLATGSRPNKFGWPGQDLQGVQGFYDLQDLELLHRNTPGMRRAVIVGGGLIGVELAEMLHSRGVAVTMLAREPQYWSNVMPRQEALLIGEVIQEAGIDLRLRVELEEIIGDSQGRVRAIRTKEGDELPCEFVGLTAGVSPNLSATVGSSIKTGRGILVDQGFRTNVPNIYGAGDCAETVMGEGQRNRIEQLWYTGQMHGEVVGRLMAGEQASYDRGIWFNSAKFIDLEWHTYGQVPTEKAAAGSALGFLYWESADRRHALRLVHDQGRLVGVNCLGIRYRHRACERWIAEARTVEEVLPLLPEGNFDPEFFHRYEQEIAGFFKEQLR